HLAAVHGAADLQRDAVGAAGAEPGGAVARRAAVAGVLPRLFSADVAGRGGGRIARLHSGAWLLHHAGSRWPAHRTADLEHDRVPHEDLAQLGSGGGARRHSARGRHGALRVLRAGRRSQPLEARLTMAAVRRKRFDWGGVEKRFNAVYAIAVLFFLI